MRRDDRHQPLSHGFTLIELLIGIAVTGTVALVLASLVEGGSNVYLFTVRQGAALTSARQAFSGNARKPGMLASAQEADSVVSTSSTSLELSPLSGSPTTWLLISKGLYEEVGSAETFLSSNVVTLTPSYYGLSSSGLIESTTIPASAELVTVFLQTQDNSPQAKVFSFYSGARLRTGP